MFGSLLPSQAATSAVKPRPAISQGATLECAPMLPLARMGNPSAYPSVKPVITPVPTSTQRLERAVLLREPVRRLFTDYPRITEGPDA